MTNVRSQIKNLFGNYGNVSRFVMPESNAICIIQFEDQSHASNVFDKLHDYTIQGTPLYLEWAPEGLFEVLESVLDKRDFESFKAERDSSPPRKSSETLNTSQQSVYVTNLNFATTAEQVEEYITSYNLSVPRAVKVISKNGKSLGFGFIDCVSNEDASELVKTLQGKMLDDHVLRLSLSKTKPNASNLQRVSKQTKQKTTESHKLMIRNIAFQSSEKELRELIGSLCDVKSLRCPRKVDGQLRGFGFAEFADVETARKALAYLGNIHFYGRKLVVEFAKAKQESEW